MLSEYVRNALARNICSQYRDDQGHLRCVTLDPTLEDTISRHVDRSDRGSFLTLPPNLANQVVNAISEQLQNLIQLGAHPVVLCSAQVRMLLKRLLSQNLPSVAVLAYNEIVKEVQIESIGMVVMDQPVAAGSTV